MGARDKGVRKVKHRLACERKVAYPTQDAARVALRDIRNNQLGGSGELKTYRCLVCKKFHVGHAA